MNEALQDDSEKINIFIMMRNHFINFFESLFKILAMLALFHKLLIIVILVI